MSESMFHLLPQSAPRGCELQIIGIYDTFKDALIAKQRYEEPRKQEDGLYVVDLARIEEWTYREKKL